MIIAALVSYIDAQVAIPLTAGTNLFADLGRADTCVILNHTSDPCEPTIPDARYASINILAKGYGAVAGHAISDSVARAILAAEGTTLSYSGSNYRLSGVTIKNWPISYSTEKGLVYTTNISIAYIKL